MSTLGVGVSAQALGRDTQVRREMSHSSYWSHSSHGACTGKVQGVGGVRAMQRIGWLTTGLPSDRAGFHPRPHDARETWLPALPAG
jgi:hypothetical protein